MLMHVIYCERCNPNICAMIGVRRQLRSCGSLRSVCILVEKSKYVHCTHVCWMRFRWCRWWRRRRCAFRLFDDDREIEWINRRKIEQQDPVSDASEPHLAHTTIHIHAHNKRKCDLSIGNANTQLRMTSSTELSESESLYCWHNRKIW